jgi:hypothetical protein
VGITWKDNIELLDEIFLAYSPYLEKIEWAYEIMLLFVRALRGNGSVKVPLLGNGSVEISLSLLGNVLAKILLSLLDNGSVETLPR